MHRRALVTMILQGLQELIRSPKKSIDDDDSEAVTQTLCTNVGSMIVLLDQVADLGTKSTDRLL
jgi:hypothetical protein